MDKQRADVRALVSHVEDCVSALQARIEAMEEVGADEVFDLKRSAQFLRGAIAALKKELLTDGSAS